MFVHIGTYKVEVNHPIKLALTEIYGVGAGRAERLHYLSYAHQQQCVKHASRRHRKYWMNFFKRRYHLGVTLKTFKRRNIKRLKYIKCYRGLRHSLFLPVRGQRTHSNRRTSRYLGSGTWQYVPTMPISKLKKVSKYVRHKPGLVERSNEVYQKLLERNFSVLQKNKRYLKQLARRGGLAQFAKLAKQKGVKSKAPVKAVPSKKK